MSTPTEISQRLTREMLRNDKERRQVSIVDFLTKVRFAGWQWEMRERVLNRQVTGEDDPEIDELESQIRTTFAEMFGHDMIVEEEAEK